MEFTPNLNATRFSKLEPGELFLFADNNAPVLGLAAKDPVQDNDVVTVILGGTINPNSIGRILGPRDGEVLSYGKEYVLRLPAEPQGWTVAPPEADKLCFVVCRQASTEQRLLLRANFSPDDIFRPCYVDMKDDRILTSSSQLRPSYLIPRDFIGYAVKWSILTKETEPRVILSQE